MRHVTNGLLAALSTLAFATAPASALQGAVPPVPAPSASASPGNDTIADPGAAPPKTIDISSFVGNPHPKLHIETKIEGHDYVNGSFTVEDKAAKVSFAPLLARPDYDFLSELRLQVAQKDGIPTIGIGWKWNPYSPRSANGKKLWVDAANATLSKPYPILEIQALQRKEKRFKQLGERIVEIDKLLKKQPPPTDEAALRAERASKAAERDSLRDELALERLSVDKLRVEYEKTFAALVLSYYDELTKSSKPIIGLSYTTAFFGAVSGSPVDKDGDQLQDNFYRIAKREASAAVDWLLSPELQFAGVCKYAWERPLQKEGTRLSESRGFGLSVGRIFNLMTPERYKETDDFKKSFFRPVIVLAFAAEFSNCRSEPDACKDKVKNTRVFTPFVDLKMKKDAQFRIGVPFTRTRSFSGTTQTDLGIVSLIAIQLGLPK